MSYTHVDRAVEGWTNSIMEVSKKCIYCKAKKKHPLGICVVNSTEAIEDKVTCTIYMPEEEK